ncbi:MAG: hypothetical protein IV086_04895 [Hyphomonadaceae bacterium]|nr:MAG: hypothetical protein FD160_5 [Caulobacteraceae bacterium]MBT9445018.1 hypothetical protein [Hyphomonadaceae bacterium]TPW01951.1 MAG: hypothetical protein FD124_3553 [Alphaproteobacteria bacterium]
MKPSDVPMITDVTVRISDAGDMFALEFEGSDGKVRSVALPVSSLTKLVSGLMWAGAESAERRVTPPLSLAERETLQHGARTMSDWRVTPSADGRDTVLEVESGAALLCVRVPPVAARLLGLALQAAPGDLS